jgi:hypothetical protein
VPVPTGHGGVACHARLEPTWVSPVEIMQANENSMYAHFFNENINHLPIGFLIIPL